MKHRTYRIAICLHVSAQSEADAESVVPDAGDIGDSGAEITNVSIIDIECVEEDDVDDN